MPIGRIGKDAWDAGKGPVFPCCNTTVGTLSNDDIGDAWKAYR